MQLASFYARPTFNSWRSCPGERSGDLRHQENEDQNILFILLSKKRILFSKIRKSSLEFLIRGRTGFCL
ncbi:hypothetical protein NPIL_532891 [Nephila pilipes]|uniref:Uncharacterized protein n=1 Tax=Nephila pilipes TaxID=299642 RepID=A0A8X6TT47_NEPPI|nr:hypothetical protein NPIL_532891 [Nephila pilipes]